VNIIISPRVGPVDEKIAIEAVLNSLEVYPEGEIMIRQWRQGNTLRVVRREPYAKSSAKILPLYIFKKS
jgi:hypothetical protein